MIVLVAALLATAGLAPLARAQMLRHGVLDLPNHRSSHNIPVPRGGGLACLGGGIVAVGLAAATGHSIPLGPLIACAGLSLVGFADDRLTLPVAPRLALQCLAGAFIGWTFAGFAGAALGLVVAAWSVNVVNFMDGINGITSMSMALWGVVGLWVGLHDDVLPLAVVGGLTAGAALGFLPWNVPNAHLFLGDAGSYLFGGLVATGLLTAWADSDHPLLVAAPLALYAVDTTWALARRIRNGEKLTEAHRDHTYQQLTHGPAGFSHLAVATGVISASAAITASWAVLGAGMATVVTAAILSAYLASPRLTRGLREASPDSGVTT